MRIAIAGTGNLGVSLWKGLDGSAHEVVAIIGDGRQTREPWKRTTYPQLGRFFGGSQSLLGRAARRGVPIHWIDRMTPEELAPIRDASLDLILVGGFSVILKRPILEIPRIGCINMHSSLLPRHRGPNPFCAAILQGDAEAGITFHVVDEGIDTDAILDQEAFEIAPRDTAYGVYLRACALAEERVGEVVDNIAREGLRGAMQDTSRASYDQKPTLNDAWINWDRPAEELDRLVRAMAPNPMPRFMHRGHVVTVARTSFDPTPVAHPPGTVLRTSAPAMVATGLGTLTLNVAFISTPFPWVWPAPWLPAKLHERLPKEFQME